MYCAFLEVRIFDQTNYFSREIRRIAWENNTIRAESRPEKPMGIRLLLNSLRKEDIMEEEKDALGMLDLLTAPGFCVKEYRIVKANAAASALFFSEGMDMEALLTSCKEDYRRFTGGCLFLSLENEGKQWNASVTRQQDMDVFVLEPEISQPELQALALAARELRGPLNSAMLMADKLLTQNDPAIADQTARLNRGLYQLLRIVSNMSDAGYVPTCSNHSLHDMRRVLDEIFQKAQLFTEAADLTMHYSGLTENIYSLCDPEQLERAIMNIFSNAIKFSPKGSTITAAVSQSSNMLRISIQDSGSGIPDSLLRSVFYRYLRQSALEDSRHGIGLGMVLIRSAALQHGGTVLIDRAEGSGTRVTMTLSIRQDAPKLCARILRPISGGYDAGLVALSEVLPVSMYDGTK